MTGYGRKPGLNIDGGRNFISPSFLVGGIAMALVLSVLMLESPIVFLISWKIGDL